MKIYIIGPAGSGKSTLGKILSNRYNIEYYELDKVVFDDEVFVGIEHRRRTDEEVKTLFDDILNKESWIIEDIGRSKFKEGREKADIIYYINLPRKEVFKRVRKRWVKQRLGKLHYDYPPTFLQFFDMLKTTKSYYKKESKKLEELKKYEDKVIFLDKKSLDELENDK